jgi:hypothetical protein
MSPSTPRLRDPADLVRGAFGKTPLEWISGGLVDRRRSHRQVRLYPLPLSFPKREFSDRGFGHQLTYAGGTLGTGQAHFGVVVRGLIVASWGSSRRRLIGALGTLGSPQTSSSKSPLVGSVSHSLSTGVPLRVLHRHSTGSPQRKPSFPQVLHRPLGTDSLGWRLETKWSLAFGRPVYGRMPLRGGGTAGSALLAGIWGSGGSCSVVPRFPAR